ncbi:hypothetical protein COU20_00105 [Candidatus Kaiserbacteria bacterium CG10_big_fil_rev_8_21_14_0_10_59_10]|uniref:V-type proton ATPase subunit E n=1 Tax=Candidatus Kaiserbacteria bacterium CG10_big_fil_rev_8_21_14_0_10_59_10 TaxID=1974612 RepID=A0A2H0U8X0_9BACT|nr:MAG: hypothetical protein COU20_00105 [Candidatus Kaiserbacteria bacterium CG10_big_fil_rev_8_21_14_0_10_59_10]
MALADILTTIKDDAMREAARVKDDARKEAEAILTRAREEIEVLTRVGKSDAERARAKTRGRIVARAGHEAAFSIQSFRISLVEDTFEKAADALYATDAKAYRSFIEARAKELPEKNGVLTVPSARREETLAALKALGIDTAQVREGVIGGGFILETKTAVYDHSMSAAVRDAKERFVGDVARDLFSS